MLNALIGRNSVLQVFHVSFRWSKPCVTGVQPELPFSETLCCSFSARALIGWNHVSQIFSPNSDWFKPCVAGVQPELPVPLPAVHRVPLLHLRDAGQPEPGACRSYLWQVRHPRGWQGSGQDSNKVRKTGKNDGQDEEERVIEGEERWWKGAKWNKMGQMYIHLWPYTKKTRLVNSSQKRTRTWSTYWTNFHFYIKMNLFKSLSHQFDFGYKWFGWKEQK